MDVNELEMLIEQKARAIGKKVERYEDRHVIESVMAHYVMRDNPRNMARNLEFFALDMPDVSIEWGDMGKFVGAEKVKYFLETQGRLKFYQGSYRAHWLANPMIEVARDGRTAKCVWLCPGAEMLTDENGHSQALWSFVRFANDFIKLGDMWYIWHLRMFYDVRCEYEKGWCEDYVKHLYFGKQDGSTDEEATWHFPVSPSFIQEDLPSCPEPYDTWVDDSWIFKNQPQYAPLKREEHDG